MFTLAISCLTTSNLLGFMDLTFQVPMQYCSLLASDFTFTTRHVHNWLWLSLFIPSGVISLLFSSSISGPYQPGDFIFQCHIFCLFILFMGFSRQEYQSGLPFPSLVGHIGLQTTRILCPWNSPGKNTGVGSHSLLQDIFLTQGLNLGLVHCRQILYHLSYQGPH